MKSISSNILKDFQTNSIRIWRKKPKSNTSLKFYIIADSKFDYNILFKILFYLNQLLI